MKYKCLVVDPPWNQGKTGKRSVRPNQGTELDYKIMAFDEIAGLPINEWSYNDAYMWIWATNSKDRSNGRPVLMCAFDLLELWGFKYHTIITWNKTTGPCPFSPYQFTTEHVIFGYKGKANFPKRSLGKMKTCFSEVSTGHSIKPQSFYSSIVKAFDGPRLDIFARQQRPGFDGWGDEYKAGKQK
ncbi:MAG: MT-A70 family methyltransferase [Candidatus Hermodarchaeia archaeon]|jgi:N6-adenosine-specific RNA methylase IME4